MGRWVYWWVAAWIDRLVWRLMAVCGGIFLHGWMQQ